MVFVCVGVCGWEVGGGGMRIRGCKTTAKKKKKGT
jgi:hypothetical protein